MSCIQSTHNQAATSEKASGVPRSLVLLMATTAGVGVASLYYSQPMLGVLGPDLGAGERAVGFVPTLTQLGYALGILLLAPLGDRMDRRRIILAKTAALMLALLASGLAPGLAPLLAAAAMALLGVALWRGLPSFRPTTQLGYGALLGSMVQLWRGQPALRRAALAQGLLSVAFSAFWSTLAVMLHQQFHMGSAAAGACRRWSARWACACCGAPPTPWR